MMPFLDREKEREYQKRYREKHSEVLKQRARERIANRSQEEKEAKNRYKREWAQKNSERLRVYKREKSREFRASLSDDELEKRREKERAYAAKYYENPENRTQRARRKRAAHHGLTADEYDAVIAKANGACELCAATDRKLVLDHCHATGVIRGVLCTACNTSIGKLGDTSKSLLRAVAYLQKSEGCLLSEPT